MNLSFGPLLIALLTTVILPWDHTALAEYTLVLKNGRRITVDAYREEGGMIKFYGIGGEVGIGKDQVQSILKAGADKGRGLSLSRPASSQAEVSEGRQEEGTSPVAQPHREETNSEAAGPARASEEPAPPELSPEDRAAKEEQEAQQKIRDINEKLKAARDRYATVTRGSAGPEPSVPFTDDQIQARTDELNSRVKDIQQEQAGARYESKVEIPTAVPRVGDPPPLLTPGSVIARPSVSAIPSAYSPREKELSDLRGQINQLENERQRIIQEMRQKNLQTGDLFE